MRPLRRAIRTNIGSQLTSRGCVYRSYTMNSSNLVRNGDIFVIVPIESRNMRTGRTQAALSHSSPITYANEKPLRRLQISREYRTHAPIEAIYAQHSQAVRILDADALPFECARACEPSFDDSRAS